MTELMSKITNEQTLANCFHGDNWIGAAERDYYLNADHEICLCASLNRRIPGRYGFIPGYSFYVAKERICTDLYFNLGNPPDRSLIVVQYDGIKAAEASPFAKDFRDLKKNIEDAGDGEQDPAERCNPGRGETDVQRGRIADRDGIADASVDEPVDIAHGRAAAAGAGD